MPMNNRCSPEKFEFAKELRRRMSSQEVRVWKFLQENHGRRFRTQEVILGFIVDFYCGDLKMILEVDGPSHFATKDAADETERRRNVLKNAGFRVYWLWTGLVDKFDDNTLGWILLGMIRQAEVRAGLIKNFRGGAK